MHKLLVIIAAVFLYVDDVYYWVAKPETVTPVDYTVLQGARTDSIPAPARKDNQEQIEIIHAQDTTVTVVVHRN